MEAKIQEVYVCQQERTDELNARIMGRNYSTQQMTPKYFSRSVSNRRVLFPKVDKRKEMTVKKAIFPKYDMTNSFHPGHGGPYNGYSDKIDDESSLFNRFQPLQKCPQVRYFPNLSSDLYLTEPFKKNNKQQPFPLLQENIQFPEFNPDSCKISNETFFNHTRQQRNEVKQ